MNPTRQAADEASKVLDALAAVSMELSCHCGVPAHTLVLSASQVQETCGEDRRRRVRAQENPGDRGPERPRPGACISRRSARANRPTSEADRPSVCQVLAGLPVIRFRTPRRAGFEKVTTRRSRELLQREADLERDLPVRDFAVDDVAAGLRHGKPVDVANREAPWNCLRTRSSMLRDGRARQLQQFVDMVRQRFVSPMVDSKGLMAVDAPPVALA